MASVRTMRPPLARSTPSTRITFLSGRIDTALPCTSAFLVVVSNDTLTWPPSNDTVELNVVPLPPP